MSKQIGSLIRLMVSTLILGGTPQASAKSLQETSREERLQRSQEAYAARKADQEARKAVRDSHIAAPSADETPLQKQIREAAEKRALRAQANQQEKKENRSPSPQKKTPKKRQLRSVKNLKRLAQKSFPFGKKKP